MPAVPRTKRPDEVPGVRARNGGWEVRVYVGKDPRTGKQRQMSRFVPGDGSIAAQTRAVEDTRRRILNELEQQRPAAQGTVGALLDAWWAKARPDLSPSTAASWDSYLRNHLRPELGAVRLSQVTTKLLDAVYADFGRKLAPASVAKCHTILQLAFAQAVRWGDLPSNPASDARAPRVTKPPITPPAQTDVALLLQEAGRDPLFFAYLMVAVDTGRRRSQILGLRWSHLELEHGTATFGRAVVIGRKDGGGTFIEERQDKADTRMTVALRPATITALTRARAATEERADAVGTTVARDGFAFSYDPECRRPWRPDGVTSRFDTVRRRAGLPTVRLHDLRHFVVTVLLANGVDVGTVTDRVGYRNPNVMLTTYRHFVPAADRRAADVIDTILSS